MFTRRGEIILAADKRAEETVMEDALDAGASDFARDGDLYVVTSEPNDFLGVLDTLKAKGYGVESSELAMIAQNLVRPDAADAQKVLKLIDVLEELDDVSKVFTNLDYDALELEEAGT
jgi:transcriptional/translational regulatory protein YebC/TACO1